ncbi:MAG: GspE/PulE family protein [Deferribacterota bacterium]|nr:GspE/PulE family protein [Deferribacterota bacterium]
MNIDKLKEEYLRFPDRSDFVPVFDEDGRLNYYYNGDSGLKKARLLALFTGADGNFEEVEKGKILEHLEEYYGGDVQGEFDASTTEDLEDVSDILSASYDDAPVIKLVNQIIINAVKGGASDIHFQSNENAFVVRFRIDGKLRTYKKFPKNLHDSVLARIKVMSMLDVAETRKPQDGRINIRVGNRSVDMRVSIMPSIFGEKAVLRILEKSKNLITLDSIGIPKEWLNKLKSYLNRPNGIILVTGPTGSGKTTTLYASLLEMDRDTKNILTIEDPVEYDIAGLTQVQVNPAVNLNFANALRAFLRQDPDVILVGEIRDEETAKAAIQASLTGHLVLSTLHTNDSPSAVARLIEMDIEPFLISSSLLLIIAQRLVRKVCPKCAIKVEADEEIKRYFSNANLPLDEYYKGKGCKECFYSGYKGRTAIFEFLEINDEIRKLINRGASAFEIRNTAKSLGFKQMFEDGYNLIKKGVTTPEEVIAITSIE